MTKPLRVLQLEDSESDALLVIRLLEKAGYSVFAERVDEAAGFREALRRDCWDIIIADCRMPGIDVAAALETLQRSGTDIPFVIVSASIGEARAVEMMKLGAHDYLMKDNLSRLAPAVERELREAEMRRQRRQAEERLSLALSATEVGTFDFNPQTGELVWSENTRRHFGLSGDAPVNFKFFKQAIHPADRDYVESQIAEALKPENGGSYSGEFRTIGIDDGITRWIYNAGKIFFNAQGEAIRFVGVIQDFTARRKLEEQLRQSQKLETVGQLAGAIAHDFNNMLGVILGFVDMISADLPDGHEMQEPLGEIRRAGERGVSLLRKLLTFSRRRVTEPKNFSLNELVLGLENLIRRILGAHIDLVLELDPAAGVMRADAADIEQAIINLAVNARDAMPDGGKLTIATALKFAASAKRLVLSISDTGIGMTDEVKSHIFEPFFTTKAPGRGTGLGLATVYGVVTQSGGRITVRSAPGAGSTFRMVFPRVEAEPEHFPAPPSAQLPMRAKTILLAEDEEKLRELIAEMLKRQGYAVIAAANGRAALETLRNSRENIDLVLADVVMPEMGGAALADALAMERPGVPMVFMSGYADHRLLGARAPGGYLQKPFTPAELLNRLEKVWAAGRGQVGKASG